MKLLSSKSQLVQRMGGPLNPKRSKVGGKQKPYTLNRQKTNPERRFHWDFRSVDLDHIVTQAGPSRPFLGSFAETPGTLWGSKKQGGS